MAALNLIQTF